jgi:hypothetical protein
VVPANRSRVLLFGISELFRSVLVTPRGEEHLLLRFVVSAAIASILPFALSSFPHRAIVSRTPHASIAIFEDITLRQSSLGVSEADDLGDLARLLAGLWEAARRLPEGSERQNAFTQIESFERRVAAFATRGR